MRRLNIAHGIGALAMIVLVSTAEAQSLDIEFYAINSDLNSRGEWLSLNPGPHSLVLTTGRECRISAISVSGARQISCTAGTDTVEFSVQCDEMRGEDHVQLRFRKETADGVAADFIEVGCRVRDRRES